MMRWLGLLVNLGERSLNQRRILHPGAPGGQVEAVRARLAQTSGVAVVDNLLNLFPESVDSLPQNAILSQSIRVVTFQRGR